MFLLLFPFFVLALIEIVLRLTGWGFNFSSDVPGWSPTGLSMFQCSENEKGAMTCETAPYYRGYANPEKFDAKKDPGLTRIFCVGGSATAGMPFFKPGSFPRMLEIALNSPFSSGHYEVINAGVKGYSSFEVRDLTEELMLYGPDILVVYMGNNEYYGTFAGLGRDGVSRAEYAVRRTAHQSRLYKLLKKTTSAEFSGPPSADKKSEEPYLLRKSAWLRERLKETSLSHKERGHAAAWYEENLEEIINIARSHNVKVVLCTIAVNKRDYPPITPDFKIDSPEGCGSVGPRICRQVLADINKVSGDAGLFYKAGCCAQMKGQKKEAGLLFQKAVDHDPMPFRASSTINGVIEKFGKQEGIVPADVEKAFTAASQNGIPGDDLFIDHVHPRLEGNKIIAMTVMEAIVPESFAPNYNWQRPVSAELERYCNKMPPDYLFGSYYTAARFCLAVGRPMRALEHINTALKYKPNARAGIEFKKYLQGLLNQKTNVPL